MHGLKRVSVIKHRVISQLFSKIDGVEVCISERVVKGDEGGQNGE